MMNLSDKPVSNTVIPAREPESRSRGSRVVARDDKRVLFLALSGIGNLIMQLPTIAAVKKAHPAWHITVWVAPKGTKAIAESQPFIDEVIEMAIVVPTPAAPRVARRLPAVALAKAGSGARVWGIIQHHIKNILTLRKHHFDIGIVLSPGQLLKSALYLFLSGVPMRIGNSYPYKGNPHASKFLTHAIDEIDAMHDIEQNIRLLEPLEHGNTQAPYYSLEVPEKNVQEADVMLSSTVYNLPSTVSYIGIHAGCAVGFEWKRWPLERFAEVAVALVQKNPNMRVLLFGGKDEAADKQAMLRMINEHFSPITVAFDISASLLTTAAIMKKCSFFVSNDSGLMHIAAATGVPVLGLFGPTSEILTGPRGKNSSVLRAPGTVAVYDTEKNNSFGNASHESLLKISVRMVLDRIAETSI